MGAFAKSFRELDVYRTGLELVVELHVFCRELPREERYCLADQMRRASRSVCSNIAEAWRKRRYAAAFVSKLNDSEAEASEMQCWLDVSKVLGYMDKKTYDQLDERYERVIAQIATMSNNPEKWCKERQGV
jgi:four helix bundle protein